MSYRILILLSHKTSAWLFRYLETQQGTQQGEQRVVAYSWTVKRQSWIGGFDRGNWQRVMEHKLCGFHMSTEIEKISESAQASRKLSIILADAISQVHFTEPWRGFLVFTNIHLYFLFYAACDMWYPSPSSSSTTTQFHRTWRLMKGQRNVTMYPKGWIQIWVFAPN